MKDLNKIYDISNFEETFKKFMEETEFGTSVYTICYESNKIGSLKEAILKMKYSDEPLQEVVMNYIPPSKMIALRNLIEEYTYKLYDKVHKEIE